VHFWLGKEKRFPPPPPPPTRQNTSQKQKTPKNKIARDLRQHEPPKAKPGRKYAGEIVSFLVLTKDLHHSLRVQQSGNDFATNNPKRLPPPPRSFSIGEFVAPPPDTSRVPAVLTYLTINFRRFRDFVRINGPPHPPPPPRSSFPVKGVITRIFSPLARVQLPITVVGGAFKGPYCEALPAKTQDCDNAKKIDPKLPSLPRESFQDGKDYLGQTSFPEGIVALRITTVCLSALCFTSAICSQMRLIFFGFLCVF